MKDLILWAAGRMLASALAVPVVKWWAFRNPHRHLYDLDGSLYMGRWNVVAKGSALSRVLSFVSGGRYESIRLHHINRADHDRDLHNHPFDYRTFVIQGHYWEEIGGLLLPCVQWVHAGQTATGSATKFHRIGGVSAGGVWTVFMMGPNTDHWGFMVDGDHFIDSETYSRMKGYK